MAAVPPLAVGLRTSATLAPLLLPLRFDFRLLPSEVGRPIRRQAGALDRAMAFERACDRIELRNRAVRRELDHQEMGGGNRHGLGAVGPANDQNGMQLPRRIGKIPFVYTHEPRFTQGHKYVRPRAFADLQRFDDIVLEQASTTHTKVSFNETSKPTYGSMAAVVFARWNEAGSRRTS